MNNLFPNNSLSLSLALSLALSLSLSLSFNLKIMLYVPCFQWGLDNIVYATNIFIVIYSN